MNVSHAYGAPMEPSEAQDFLLQALDAGYDFFDTAALYGAGENEKLVGKALRARRGEYVLASKCVLGFNDGQRVLDGRPKTIKRFCEESLQRLGDEVIDIYYLHRRDPSVPIEDSVGAVADLVSEGKVIALGLSEMSVETLIRANDTHPVAAMQSEYSLWSRNPELGVLYTCLELGVAFVAFSPLARGFLADTPPNPTEFHPSDIRRNMPRFSAENYAKNLGLLEKLKPLADAAGLSISAFALAWVLTRGKHVIALPGTTSHTHMLNNIVAGDHELDSELVAQADLIFAPENIVGNRYPSGAQKQIDTEQFAFELTEITK
tara:strand:+ start:3072 stop:4031 length:960 start_codon:yes stop_codon:yes gene_type:complete